MKTLRAFSLIELLVALAILAVVAALLVPRFLKIRERAEEVTAKAIVKQVNSVYLQWRALGGEPNNSAGFSIIYFLSQVPSSSTADRDCDIGECTDTKGRFGSTTVSLTGVDVVQVSSSSVSSSYWFSDATAKNSIYGWESLIGFILKIDRDIWSVRFDSTRQDPFYFYSKVSNYDQNFNYSDTTIY